MKNRNRGEDGTLATQSVTTFIKNSKVLRGARRKGRSRRKMSQFPTREPFPFAVKTSLRNSSSCKSQSLSLFLSFFPINPCPRSNRIVRDRERGVFLTFLSRRGSFYSSRHPKKNPASGGILFSRVRVGEGERRKGKSS